MMNKLREFFSIDIRSLALFRIGLALVVLCDLFIRMHDIKAFYSDEGILPRSVLIESALDNWNFSINLMSGMWEIQLLLMIMLGIFATFLLIGYKTRLATAATWVLLLSLQLRNPIALQGGDAAEKLFLFFGMFLPLGACWSLDMRLKKSPEKSVEKSVFSIGTAALLLQVCFIYWFAALLKNDPTWKTEGTAIWYALSIEQYATPLGLFLLGYPLLLKILTISTFYLEALGPFFAFSPIWTGPLRLATVIIFILFHLGLALTIELAQFPYICAVGWLAFIPPCFWNFFSIEEAQTAPCLKFGKLSNGLAAFFLVYVALWNVQTLKVPLPFFSTWKSIGNFLGLDQKWDMFSPYPLTLDGWYVIPGTLRNGQVVDLFTGRDFVSWIKPPLLSATYKNDRWRSYLMNLAIDEEGDASLFFPSYASYLCNEWDASHPFEQQLISLDIYYMSKINNYDAPTYEYKKQRIWQQKFKE